MCESIGHRPLWDRCPLPKKEKEKEKEKKRKIKKNKAGYTATPDACGWAGTIFEVTRAFGQEQ